MVTSEATAPNFITESRYKKCKLCNSVLKDGRCPNPDHNN